MNDERPPNRRQAVALRYQQHESAPRVVAKGYGELADRITAAAREHDIFTHEAPELVALLMELDLEQEIPPQLYVIVAELLVWVAELEHAKGSQQN